MHEAIRSDADIVKGRYKIIYPDEIADALLVIQQFAEAGKIYTGQDCGDILTFHPSIWTCINKNCFLKEHLIVMNEVQGVG